MRGHPVLVAGGAGYIGSHIAKVLSRQGYTPIIIDDLSMGHRSAVEALHGVPFYEGCVSDEGLVSKVIKLHGVESVMHFSAKALVAESVADPLLYYNANVVKTLALLGTLRRCGVKHFVFSSTCATYGEPLKTPIVEDAPQRPINPYGVSKRMVEEILRDCQAAYGLHSVILRYFNAAGADPEGQIGESHHPETHLIPIVLETALGRRQKLVIHGGDYPTADGTCIRDYVHVNDLASGHIKALEHSRAAGGCTDFNLGSGRGYSNLEVVKTVEKVLGRKVSYEIGPRRPGDPPILIADSTKARQTLQWSPTFDFTRIIETAALWAERSS